MKLISNVDEKVIMETGNFENPLNEIIQGKSPNPWKEMDTNIEALDQIDTTWELLKITLLRTCLEYKSKKQYIRIYMGKMLWCFAWEMSPLVLDIWILGPQLVLFVGIWMLQPCWRRKSLGSDLEIKMPCLLPFCSLFASACSSGGELSASHYFLCACCLLLLCAHYHKLYPSIPVSQNNVCFSVTCPGQCILHKNIKITNKTAIQLKRQWYFNNTNPFIRNRMCQRIMENIF